MLFQLQEFGQTGVQTCNLRNFRERRSNLEGLSDRCNPLSGVRALQITIHVVVDATELVTGKIQLQAQAETRAGKRVMDFGNDYELGSWAGVLTDVSEAVTLRTSARAAMPSAV